MQGSNAKLMRKNYSFFRLGSGWFSLVISSILKNASWQLRTSIHFGLWLALACAHQACAQAPVLPLIPLPERVERHPGQFDLSGPHRILLVPDEPPVRQAAQRLTHLITGNTTTSIVTSNPAAPGDIIMERVADAAPDSYTLEKKY